MANRGEARMYYDILKACLETDPAHQNTASRISTAAHLTPHKCNVMVEKLTEAGYLSSYQRRNSLRVNSSHTTVYEVSLKGRELMRAYDVLQNFLGPNLDGVRNVVNQ